jgi:hypothetical protein
MTNGMTDRRRNLPKRTRAPVAVVIGKVNRESLRFRVAHYPHMCGAGLPSH